MLELFEVRAFLIAKNLFADIWKRLGKEYKIW